MTAAAPKTLGRWIRQHRRRLGLSQRQLATDAGLSLTSVNQYENNVTAPSWQSRRKLHAVFGTKDSDLSRLGIPTLDTPMEDDE